MAAVGVVLALLLAQRTARVVMLNAGHIWNLCVVALFAALISTRLLLVIVNWKEVLRRPAWILGLAVIHHPLLGAVGAMAGTGCVAVYARWQKMPLLTTADALAAPLALGLAFEQVGALLAGSGYGTQAGHGVRWAITYTNPLAAVWSGAPLGIPLHPVQGYAALGFAALAILVFFWLPYRRREGDVAGLWFLGMGAVVYMTELWRDRDGRGSILGGVLDGPQVAAVAMVLAGALLLRERKTTIPHDADAAGAVANAANEARHG